MAAGVAPRAAGRAWAARHVASYFLAGMAAITSWITYISFTRDQATSGAWGCEMSWMTPAYVRVPWRDPPSTKYALYLYREQGWDSEETTGYPVIFVPGNAGSFQQVRSIASSASRQFHGRPGDTASDMVGITKLDFFAIDYNEDFSAFHAPTCRDQADFLIHAIARVLQNYEHLPPISRPTHVTLVGHSMGGVVARLASAVDATKIDAIVTLSSPQLLLPVTFERDMDTIRETITRAAATPRSPPLLSICGGVSDTQVVSDACALTSEHLGNNSGFAVFTTAMPGVWTTVEHQAIVWCHQVRWRVARALLEMTRGERMKVAKSWLVGDGQSEEEHLLEGNTREFSASVTSLNMSLTLRPAPDSPADRPHAEVQWCGVENCRPLRYTYTAFPEPRDQRAPFPLPGEGAQPGELAYSLSFQVPVNHGQIMVHAAHAADIRAGEHEAHVVHGSSWVGPPDVRPVIRRTISFPGKRLSSLVVRNLVATVEECEDRMPVIRYREHRGTSLGPTHESLFFPLQSSPMALHGHLGDAPFIERGKVARGFDIDIYQHTSCQVSSLRISVDYGASLAKAVIRFRMAAIAWSLGWAALVLLYQLRQTSATGSVAPFAEALEVVCRKSVRILGCIAALSWLAQLLKPSAYGASMWLGTRDPATLIFVPVLGVLTLGEIVCLRCCGVLTVRTCRRIWRPQATESQTLASSSRVLSASLLLLFVWWIIPRQMASVILLAVQAITALICNVKQPESTRARLACSTTLMMALFLPFNAVVLAVWGRNMWADWRQPFHWEHNPLYLLPTLLVVEAGVSNEASTLRPMSVRACQLSLGIFAACAFCLGPRNTWLLPLLGDAVFASLAGMMMWAT